MSPQDTSISIWTDEQGLHSDAIEHQRVDVENHQVRARSNKALLLDEQRRHGRTILQPLMGTERDGDAAN
jgi:hypothetical protein